MGDERHFSALHALQDSIDRMNVQLAGLRDMGADDAARELLAKGLSEIFSSLSGEREWLKKKKAYKAALRNRDKKVSELSDRLKGAEERIRRNDLKMDSLRNQLLSRNEELVTEKMDMYREVLRISEVSMRRPVSTSLTEAVDGDASQLSSFLGTVKHVEAYAEERVMLEGRVQELEDKLAAKTSHIDELKETHRRAITRLEDVHFGKLAVVEQQKMTLQMKIEAMTKGEKVMHENMEKMEALKDAAEKELAFAKRVQEEDSQRLHQQRNEALASIKVLRSTHAVELSRVRKAVEAMMNSKTQQLMQAFIRAQDRATTLEAAMDKLTERVRDVQQEHQEHRALDRRELVLLRKQLQTARMTIVELREQKGTSEDTQRRLGEIIAMSAEDERLKFHEARRWFPSTLELEQALQASREREQALQTELNYLHAALARSKHTSSRGTGAIKLHCAVQAVPTMCDAGSQTGAAAGTRSMGTQTETHLSDVAALISSGAHLRFKKMEPAAAAGAPRSSSAEEAHKAVEKAKEAAAKMAQLRVATQLAAEGGTELLPGSPLAHSGSATAASSEAAASSGGGDDDDEEEDEGSTLRLPPVSTASHDGDAAADSKSSGGKVRKPSRSMSEWAGSQESEGELSDDSFPMPELKKPPPRTTSVSVAVGDGDEDKDKADDGGSDGGAEIAAASDDGGPVTPTESQLSLSDADGDDVEVPAALAMTEALVRSLLDSEEGEEEESTVALPAATSSPAAPEDDRDGVEAGEEGGKASGAERAPSPQVERDDASAAPAGEHEAAAEATDSVASASRPMTATAIALLAKDDQQLQRALQVADLIGQGSAGVAALLELTYSQLFTQHSAHDYPDSLLMQLRSTVARSLAICEKQQDAAAGLTTWADIEGLPSRPSSAGSRPSSAHSRSRSLSRPPSAATVRTAYSRPGSALPGRSRPGSARPGSARPGSARPGSARPGSARSTSPLTVASPTLDRYVHMYKTTFYPEVEEAAADAALLAEERPDSAGRALPFTRFDPLPKPPTGERVQKRRTPRSARSAGGGVLFSTEVARLHRRR
eukprot:PLAT6572.1.p1 GENE.PLAT6572.1~~PLAT6572.1.p1  ORF type:complete len:1058 (-),score=273.20 PLAT6572.1:87-3260(-)